MIGLAANCFFVSQSISTKDLKARLRFLIKIKLLRYTRANFADEVCHAKLHCPKGEANSRHK
jgi:hypothetical protein